jgi:ribosomal protein S4
LNYIIFRGGFGISLDYCKQIIYQGYIKVNGKTIKNPKYKLKKGSIIKNEDPRGIFSYYMNKCSSNIPLFIDNKR